MSNRICICCAGRMMEGSPTNPNICVTCEQLLAEDVRNIDAMLAEHTAQQNVTRLPEARPLEKIAA